MANFSQAFGYKVYLVPILKDNVDLTELNLAPNSAGGFMDASSVVADTLEVSSFGTGATFKIGTGGASQTVTNAVIASGTATLTFASNTFAVNDIVEVSGLAAPFAGLNGTHLVTAQDGTTIDFATTEADQTSAAASGTVYGFTPISLDGTATPFRLLGLTDASLQTTTGDEEVITYDEETKGYDQAVAVKKGATIKLSGLSDFYDPAYQVARIIEQEAVAEGTMCKLLREGPTGVNEATLGFGRLMSFNEKNPAGTIVKWDADFKFYGPYKTKPARA